MTAQPRTTLVSNITALLADNTNKAISPTDVRQNLIDLLDTLHGIYGSLTVSGNSSAQSVTTTAARLTAWGANGLSSGTTPDHVTNNGISVGTAGIYMVEFSADITFATATWTLNLAKNTTPDTTLQFGYVAGSSVRMGASIVGLISCAQNDLISVYATSNNGSGANLTLHNAQLVVRRVG